MTSKSMFVMVAIAGCAHAPPTESPIPPPPMVEAAEGGWFDSAGFYHNNDSTFIARLPRDAELHVAELENKQVLIGGVEEMWFTIIWWRADTMPSQSGIDEYISSIDTESQLAADPIHDVEMRGAMRARATHWTDPGTGVTTEIRVGWRFPWCVAMMSWATKDSRRAAELDAATASLGFAK